MTVVMKIDLVGPERRGLALGLNEAAGYGGVALAAGAQRLARRRVRRARRARRRRRGRSPLIALAALGAVRPRHRRPRRARAGARTTPTPTTRRRACARRSRDATYRVPALRSCSQAGLVNNLNDALAWGLVPLFLAAHGASVARDRPGRRRSIPAVWGVGQICDRPLVRPRRPQAADRRRHAPPGRRRSALLAASRRRASASPPSPRSLLGVGTALVYPTLIAAISDAVSPVARAPVVGVYRFWRDMGYVARRPDRRRSSPTPRATAARSLSSPASPPPPASGSRVTCRAPHPLRRGTPHVPIRTRPRWSQRGRCPRRPGA